MAVRKYRNALEDYDTSYGDESCAPLEIYRPHRQSQAVSRRKLSLFRVIFKSLVGVLALLGIVMVFRSGMGAMEQVPLPEFVVPEFVVPDVSVVQIAPKKNSRTVESKDTETVEPVIELAKLAQFPVSPVVSPVEDSAIEVSEVLTPDVNSILHTIKRGETLSEICSKYGFEPVVANVLDKALRDFSKESGASVHKLKPGRTIKFTSDGDRLAKAEFKINTAKTVVLEAKVGSDSFTAHIDLLPTEAVERVASGTIVSSFAAAANKLDIAYDIVDDLADLLGDRVLFHKDFRKGDGFSVEFVENKLPDGSVVSVDPVTGALFTVNGVKYAIVRFVGADGKARYFDEKGEPLGNRFLRYPVRFSRISSMFSDARLHPILHRRMPHNGVDFVAPTGTPVRSVSDGRVIFAGRKGPNGIMIKIRHSKRYKTAYLHLSKITKGIRKGGRVTRGQVIGAVGTTGRSTGPHLHYAFYDKGKYVDPLKVKLPFVENLNKKNKIPSKTLKQAVARLGGNLPVKGNITEVRS